MAQYAPVTQFTGFTQSFHPFVLEVLGFYRIISHRSWIERDQVNDTLQPFARFPVPSRFDPVRPVSPVVEQSADPRYKQADLVLRSRYVLTPGRILRAKQKLRHSLRISVGQSVPPEFDGCFSGTRRHTRTVVEIYRRIDGSDHHGACAELRYPGLVYPPACDGKSIGKPQVFLDL